MASFMRVPSFDDDGDAVMGVGGGREEAAASARERETADDSRVDARGKKRREREESSSREDSRARGERHDGRRRMSANGREGKKNRRREGKTSTGGDGDDAKTGGASREERKKTSGKNLGRRRRAAEKRRRLAEERRAARGGDARAKRKSPEPEPAGRTVDDDDDDDDDEPASESSDYDEELLPEPRLETNDPVSASESEDDEIEARRRRAAQAGAAGAKSSAFMNKMRAKLSGGQFRMLNEKLYTTTGDEGLDLVKNAPELFEAYHAGFRAQVESWPTKPVDVVAALLKRSPKSWIVADFGCGDAELGRLIEQKCHSFDLQTPESAPEVVACNMSDVPLDDASVDCAVFSLSLMGTDYGSFLEEAHRVLKPGGLLWIAEVRSRFDGKNGTASVASFVAALAALGFKRKRDVDERNTMFFTAEFIKTWVSKGKHSNTSTHRAVRWPPLKACTYKRR